MTPLRLKLYATLFGVLLLIGGLLVIPIGPVPITLQTLILFVCVLILPRAHALLAILLFVLLRGLMNGPALFISPTFGYILAFFIVPLIVKPTNQKPIPSLIAAQLSIYAIGCAYFAIIQSTLYGTQMGFVQILMATVVPFIPFDCIKLWIAPTIAKRLKEIV